MLFWTLAKRAVRDKRFFFPGREQFVNKITYSSVWKWGLLCWQKSGGKQPTINWENNPSYYEKWGASAKSLVEMCSVEGCRNMYTFPVGVNHSTPGDGGDSENRGEAPGLRLARSRICWQGSKVPKWGKVGPLRKPIRACEYCVSEKLTSLAAE